MYCAPTFIGSTPVLFRYRAILYTQSCKVKSICCCCLAVSDIHIGTVGGVIVSNSTFSLLRWAILTSVLDQRRLTIVAFWSLSVVGWVSLFKVSDTHIKTWPASSDPLWCFWSLSVVGRYPLFKVSDVHVQTGLPLISSGRWSRRRFVCLSR